MLAHVAPAGEGPPPVPFRYDDALGAWISDTALRGALSEREQYAAAVALGLLE